MKDGPRHRGSPAHVATQPDEPELPVSIIIVAGLALVHLAMAATADSLTQAVIDIVEPAFGEEPALLAATMTPWIPLVVVVAVWTRDQRLGVVAAAVALAISTLPYLRGVVVDQLVQSGRSERALDVLDWTNWLLTALLPLGAALAWGIARRHGSRWWPGLLPAAAVAVLFRWLELDPFPEDPALRRAFAATVYHVVPAVLAGLACWWLDSRERAR